MGRKKKLDNLVTLDQMYRAYYQFVSHNFHPDVFYVPYYLWNELVLENTGTLFDEPEPKPIKEITCYDDIVDILLD